uniref:NADH-ubiquinone oxidoreductase chain 2 n=1 Tax=Taeniothrips tigris TaxID=2824824 RepID=A0A8A9WMQ9_9NEOP|nr:NADH dehydrogenase subunit 2 [Taeniothrips tigris]QTT60735.1 NADH dehydrogenase subunit 2 [Taeniothrips tigris]
MKNILIQKLIFMMLLIMSIIMCLSSNSFLGIWMSMEINMFSFISIMSMNQTIKNEKSTMVYFLIQSISSTMILMSILYMHMNMNFLELMKFFLMMSIFTKLGLFPFYSWMIMTIEGMTWNTCFIMLTMQKIIPLVSLMMMTHKKLIMIFSLTSMMISSMKGLTMFSLRKIMGFSSMNHLSIMLMSLMLSKKLFKLYFLIYSFMTFSLTKIMKNFEMNFLFQSMNLYKFNKINNLILITLIMSMAGIPPFLGFMPKMLVIMKMMEMKMIFLTSFILILNTLSTYFYMRMMLTNLMMNLNSNKLKKKEKNNKFPLFIMLTPIMIMFMM